MPFMFVSCSNLRDVTVSLSLHTDLTLPLFFVVSVEWKFQWMFKGLFTPESLNQGPYQGLWVFFTIPNKSYSHCYQLFCWQGYRSSWGWFFKKYYFFKKMLRLKKWVCLSMILPWWTGVSNYHTLLLHDDYGAQLQATMTKHCAAGKANSRSVSKTKTKSTFLWLL